ncbi:hypothetical protein FPRO05_12233 [Fusarium proliferatum]|uniref:Pisatin demethylase n=1 Tax=Gibberella intermedia TaxID=948311 RepID=A0A365N4F1_GIBIN|nr:hypothetical protein FPRO05_12233 [Fusarium proliferatum]
MVGPIVRIAPDQYSLDNPEAAKIIYGHGTQFVKASWYLPWGDPVDRNLFNEIDPKVHGIMRRQVSNVYTMSNMVSYEPYVDECTEILCQRLIEFSASNVPINMARWFQYYAFDMIGKITFSKRFGCLDAGKDHRDIIKALDDSAQLASALGLYPLIFHYLLKIFKYLSKDQDAKGPAYIAQYAEEQVAARQIEKQRDDKPQDFVAKLLEGQKERPDTVTDHAIRLSSGANIAAGSDTTAITLSNILYNLCKHPATMHKLRQELGDARASGHISNPITFREAQGLPYLQAVIKEGLRLYPAVGFTMPRVVPKGGKRLAGRLFPEGTIVGINPWVAHHNTDIFGQDADEFRPERWLSSSQQTIEKKEMEAYFMAFGLGSRTCIVGRMHAINIAASFDHILSQITQDPSLPLNQVMGVRTRDLDQTSDWNRVLSLPEDKCLHDLLIEKVIEDPTRAAGFHTDVGAASSIGITHIGQKPVVPPVSVAVIWDDRAVGEDDVKRVMEMWKGIIVSDLTVIGMI